MKNECKLSDHCIGMLTYNYGDYGTVPKDSPFLIQAMHILHWLRGAYYPVGGPENIAAQIVPTIENTGGKVFVRAMVEEILLDEIS
eukprot:Pgem_evm1s12620